MMKKSEIRNIIILYIAWALLIFTISMSSCCKSGMYFAFGLPALGTQIFFWVVGRDEPEIFLVVCIPFVLVSILLSIGTIC